VAPLTATSTPEDPHFSDLPSGRWPGWSATGVVFASYDPHIIGKMEIVNLTSGLARTGRRLKSPLPWLRAGSSAVRFGEISRAGGFELQHYRFPGRQSSHCLVSSSHGVSTYQPLRELSGTLRAGLEAAFQR
jgi:hypothetical protein